MIAGRNVRMRPQKLYIFGKFSVYKCDVFYSHQHHSMTVLSYRFKASVRAAGSRGQLTQLLLHFGISFMIISHAS